MEIDTDPWLEPTAAIPASDPSELAGTIRVSALHALAYCPRLFYLEEVEELYVQDAAVFAGRKLHEELAEVAEGEWVELTLESEALGLRGKLDALRSRDGQLIPYEHKRGRCRRGPSKQPEAWPSDRLQLLAYACLLEAALNVQVQEGRIRYHAENVLVRVPIDPAGRAEVAAAIAQARELRRSTQRPPVTDNDRLCARCSLAPVCLPEEARLVHDRGWEPVRLFPADDDREVVHVLEAGTRVGRKGEQLKLTQRDNAVNLLPVERVGQVVLHSYSQISTQALHFCHDRAIGVHFVSGGGRYMGGFDYRAGSIQRRVRQYCALSDPNTSLQLARKLVIAKTKSQRQFLMRVRRTRSAVLPLVDSAIIQMKPLIDRLERAESLAGLLGFEGKIAALYFSALPSLLVETVPPELQFSDRNRRPPRDRFNCLLGFGYGLLLKDITNALIAIGLEPALGFYHQPRSQAPPLALDLMELFRLPLVELLVLASVNRGMWQPEEDFAICTVGRGKAQQQVQQVWLSDEGRRKFIQLYERRKQDVWKHPVTGYSLTYRRLFELEARLLEKEWSGEPGLFAAWSVR
ncbi:MAG: type I-MYXAN CRISPR-associated endonuclease Cas1 [Oscillatoriales cyanobacterium]|nr:MAG: type I-MYXAN CRISPR-associated endonuclease Cas1 [Oscillatoriales cyanobacterium]